MSWNISNELKLLQNEAAGWIALTGQCLLQSVPIHIPSVFLIFNLVPEAFSYSWRILDTSFIN